MDELPEDIKKLNEEARYNPREDSYTVLKSSRYEKLKYDLKEHLVLKGEISFSLIYDDLDTVLFKEYTIDEIYDFVHHTFNCFEDTTLIENKETSYTKTVVYEGIEIVDLYVYSNVFITLRKK